MDAPRRPDELARRDMAAHPETASGGALQERALARPGMGAGAVSARLAGAATGPAPDAPAPRGKSPFRHGQDHAGAKRLLIGWREWALFPDLGLPPIRGKVDTGARSSALHALHIKEIRLENGQRGVHFLVHPRQRLRTPEFECRAPIHDRREVRSSNGQVETRYVLRTRLIVGPLERVIELTLTNRSAMGYRLLIGRQALRGAVLIDPAASHLVGLPNAEVG